MKATTADLIDALKELFPEAFTEGKVDFDVLKQLLGGAVEQREEKYGLGWHGKRQARQVALTPSLGTLRPCRPDSVAWDTTQNLVIEGDNLEVLKLLQKSYAGKVKLIYIDPPYNTGRDFVYPDDFRDSIGNYLRRTGQVGDGRKLTGNTEAGGRFHTDWLNMMYPRLVLARDLLREDGVIFLSIDDGEVGNLKCLCCEIFGEDNFVACVVWQKKYARQNDSTTLSTSHDYILLFAKDLQRWTPGELKRDEGRLKGYKNPDNDPRGRWQSVVYTCNKTRAERPNLFYPIHHPVTGKEVWPDESRVWAHERSRTERNIREGRLWWGRNGELQKPRLKSYLGEVGAGLVPDTLWLRDDVGDTQEAAREISSLFGAPVFGTPKPLRLIDRCIQVANCTGSDVILDFFAGSGTTGAAAYARNARTGDALRFILVQLPERLDGGNRTQKVAAEFCGQAGVSPAITELTKERLRRAAARIRAEHPAFVGDLGFRVFELDSSNPRPWSPDRGEDDILCELLLKLGLDLGAPIETKTVAGKRVYSVGRGVLLACLDGDIGRKEAGPLAAGIAGWHQTLAPAVQSQVVFRDAALADDVARANLTAALSQCGLSDVRSL